MGYDLAMYLDDIESRIDPGDEQAIYDAWVAHSECRLSGHGEGRSMPSRKASPSGIRWPGTTVNESLESIDAMIYSQLKQVSDMLEYGGKNLLWMRANYGVGILPTVFGCPIFVMPPETNTLPNVRPLPGGEDALRAVAEGEIPDFSAGWGANVFACAERFAAIRQQYPKIARWVRIDHPDCQGPIDLAELLWGSDIFYTLYDQPALVHALLEKITATYIAFLDRWFSIVPTTDGYHTYFGRMHKGTLTIRNDSSMNLSPGHYVEYVRPYDQRVLTHFGGGMIHFCGRGTHFIGLMGELEKLYAIDLSQPHLNDMEIILSATVDKGITLHTLPDPGIEKLRDGGHRFDLLAL